MSGKPREDVGMGPAKLIHPKTGRITGYQCPITRRIYRTWPPAEGDHGRAPTAHPPRVKLRRWQRKADLSDAPDA